MKVYTIRKSFWNESKPVGQRYTTKYLTAWDKKHCKAYWSDSCVTARLYTEDQIDTVVKIVSMLNNNADFYSGYCDIATEDLDPNYVMKQLKNVGC